MLRLLWWECTNAQAPLMRMCQCSGSSDEMCQCLGSSDENVLIHRLLWWECANAQAPLMRMYQCSGSSYENVPIHRLLWWECANAQAPLMRMCQCTGSSDENVPMHRLIWAFRVFWWCGKCQNLICWLKYWQKSPLYFLAPLHLVVSLQTCNIYII